MNSTTIRTMLASHSQIKVLQLNCNRKPTVIHELLNKQFDKADILLLQEPSWSRISPDGKKEPIGHNSWTPILPVNTYKPGDPEPRVMAYVQRKPGLEVALRSDIIQDCDIQILSASYPGNPTITIINLYNDKNHQNNRATKLIQRLPLIPNQPIIITED